MPSDLPTSQRQEARFRPFRLRPRFAVRKALRRPAPGAELQLLLRCARVALQPDDSAVIQALLAGPLDWGLLEQLARQHKLQPLLDHSLRQLGYHGVPEPVRQRLQRSVQATSLQNLQLLAELLEILRLFEQHQIPALPFKGPLIGEQLYGSQALRQFNDLDIFVPLSELPRAQQLLISRGYRIAEELADQGRSLEAGRPYDCMLVRDDQGIAVELQWGVARWPFFFPRDFVAWWVRLQPVTLARHPMQSLPPADLLLALCVHGCKHRWERLNWLVDISEFLRRHPDLDWAALLERATRLGARRMLWIGLLLAQELLQAPVPAEILRQARRDGGARRLAVQVQHSQCGRNTSRLAIDEAAPLFYFRMLENLHDRLRLLIELRTGFSHPLRLFWRYLLRPLRRLLPDSSSQV